MSMLVANFGDTFLFSFPSTTKSARYKDFSDSDTSHYKFITLLQSLVNLKAAPLFNYSLPSPFHEILSA